MLSSVIIAQVMCIKPNCVLADRDELFRDFVCLSARLAVVTSTRPGLFSMVSRSSSDLLVFQEQLQWVRAPAAGAVLCLFLWFETLTNMVSAWRRGVYRCPSWEHNNFFLSCETVTQQLRKGSVICKAFWSRVLFYRFLFCFTSTD